MLRASNSNRRSLLGLALATVPLAFVVAACDDQGRRVDDRMEQGLSAAAERWLRVAEDQNLPLKERGDAARELGKLKEPSVIPRLARLLPGDYTVLGFDIINTLGEIGDAKALPVLENYAAVAEKNGVSIPGKINAALDGAIEQCKGR